MSLGGLTALCLAAGQPRTSVARLGLVDITPGTDAAKAEPILAFLAGPERFGSLQEILERTIAFNPTRSVASLRRGVMHNARQFPDGSWRWRWDPSARWRTHPSAEDGGRFESLWCGLQHPWWSGGGCGGGPGRCGCELAGGAGGAGRFTSL